MLNSLINNEQQTKQLYSSRRIYLFKLLQWFGQNIPINVGGAILKVSVWLHGHFRI